ncbi:MAG TPA: hypothetical protein PL001_04380, partial [Candidatus Kryptobacter bacterium]|nr:hypothetical protein [Candidatus Kryptobacter bacterium]
HAMNVKPKNYTWPEFYQNVIDLTKYTFTWKAIARRFAATGSIKPRLMNVLRAVSSEGFGRIKYFTEVSRLLRTDRQFRGFFEKETTDIPPFYTKIVKKDLGSLWDWLPPGAMYHDPNGYLSAVGGSAQGAKAESSLGKAEIVRQPVLVP